MKRKNSGLNQNPNYNQEWSGQKEKRNKLNSKLKGLFRLPKKGMKKNNPKSSLLKIKLNNSLNKTKSCSKDMHKSVLIINKYNQKPTNSKN